MNFVPRILYECGLNDIELYKHTIKLCTDKLCLKKISNLQAMSKIFVNVFDGKKPSSASTFTQVYSLSTFHLFYGQL